MNRTHRVHHISCPVRSMSSQPRESEEHPRPAMERASCALALSHHGVERASGPLSATLLVLLQPPHLNARFPALGMLVQVVALTLAAAVTVAGACPFAQQWCQHHPYYSWKTEVPPGFARKDLRHPDSPKSQRSVQCLCVGRWRLQRAIVPSSSEAPVLAAVTFATIAPAQRASAAVGPRQLWGASEASPRSSPLGSQPQALQPLPRATPSAHLDRAALHPC